MTRIKGLHELALKRIPYLWSLKDQAKYKMLYGNLNSNKFREELLQDGSYFICKDGEWFNYIGCSIPTIVLPNLDKNSILDRIRSDPSSVIGENKVFYHTFFSDSDFNTGDMYEFMCEDIERQVGGELSRRIMAYKDSSLSVYIVLLHVSDVVLEQKVIVGLNGDDIIFMVALVDKWRVYTEGINSLKVSRSSGNICFNIQLMDSLNFSFQLVGNRYKLSNLTVN